MVGHANIFIGHANVSCVWCVGLEADLVYTIEIVAENEKGKFDILNYFMGQTMSLQKKQHLGVSLYMRLSLETHEYLIFLHFLSKNCAILQRLNAYVDNRRSITVLSIHRSVRQLFYVISRTIMEKMWWLIMIFLN